MTFQVNVHQLKSHGLRRACRFTLSSSHGPSDVWWHDAAGGTRSEAAAAAGPAGLTARPYGSATGSAAADAAGVASVVTEASLSRIAVKYGLDGSCGNASKGDFELDKQPMGHLPHP